MRERLCSQAGVNPTNEWLSVCRNYLRQQPSSNDDEDDVLHQIIHTDLRNVVRHCSAVDDNNATGTGNDAGISDVPSSSRTSNIRNNDSDVRSHSRILRQSIINSCKIQNENNRGSNTDNCCKAVLPHGFLLMLQIEELLDVSKNAESRLSLGPASSTSPAPVGNQSRRCLKLLLSDGYYENGSSQPANAADNNAGSISTNQFVAMETKPIPNLSAHSMPGIKVVLSGPIYIYMGVLMLDSSNTAVVGGFIPSLIQVQKKAISCAAKVAGVGIDPTYRALVWNPDTGMEDENDEGEQESSDVQVDRRPQNYAASIPIQHSNSNQSNSIPTFTANSSSHNQGSNSSTNTMIGSNTVNMRSNIGPILTSARQNHNSTLPSTGNISSLPSTAHLMNTVNRNFTSLQSHNGTTASAIPRVPISTLRTLPLSSSSIDKDTSAPASVVTSKVHNVYAKTTSIGINQAPSTIHTTIHTKTATKPSTASSASLSTPPTNDDLIEDENHTKQTACTQNKISTKKQQTTSTYNSSSSVLKTMPLSPTALSEPLSFAELRHLLQQIIIHPNLYDDYFRKTFLVPCKMHPKQKETRDICFNIEKNRSYKKSKNSEVKTEKYLYLIVCQMTGKDEDESVTCKLANDFIRPYAKVGAPELRKISQRNRDEANKIANDCGVNVVGDLEDISLFEFKLLHSKENFFKNDGSNGSIVEGRTSVLDSKGDPVLLLCARK